MKTISFIGGGNMGGAVAQAVCKAIDPQQVVVYDKHLSRAQELADRAGCVAAKSVEEAVRASKYILYAVKPQIYSEVSAEVTSVVKECVAAGEEKVIVSLMAGISVEALENTCKEAGMDLPVVRMLPNTPALVGEGLFLVTGNKKAQESGCVSEVIRLLACGGLAEETTEHMLDVATPLYSCSPAWVYMFIEALADGGVAIGVPRAEAIRYAAQGVLGAAAMVLEMDQHPGALKDAVCSPGGITIQGVATLEKYGMRNAVIEAIQACEKKRQEIAR